MPPQPDLAYAEWDGWDDWLGVMRSYADAKAVVAGLGVLTQEQWWAVTREQPERLSALRVPSRPHIFYAAEWEGYSDWLGLPDTPLVLPRGYLGDAAD